MGTTKRVAWAAVVATALCLASGSFAITNPTIDPDTADRNVGALVGVAPSGATKLFCSGTLIAPTVFLTAAHCIQNIQALPGARVAVSFDTTYDPATSTLIYGTPVISPYGDDLAVVLLDSAPAGIKPVTLVGRVGYLDTLNLKDATFKSVGYGVSEPVNAPGGPTVEGAGTRRATLSAFNSLTKSFLKLKQNQGFGGTCTGDSGGPQFLGGVQVSVTVTGDTQCSATTVAQRLDTATAHAFLAPYLAR